MVLSEIVLADAYRHAAPPGHPIVCGPRSGFREVARTLDAVTCPECSARIAERPQLWNLLRAAERAARRLDPMVPLESPPIRLPADL